MQHDIYKEHKEVYKIYILLLQILRISLQIIIKIIIKY